MDVFMDLLLGERQKWKSFKNNIVINDKHIYLDFDNEVIIKNGEHFIYSVGVEHYKH